MTTGPAIRSFAGAMDRMHVSRIGSDARTACGVHAHGHAYGHDGLTAEEQRHLGSLSDRKRTEWLASRELLFTLLDDPSRPECRYDEFGKPYIVGRAQHISVSHSEGWCAAMTASRPCGVDIQVYSDTVGRIAPRFMNRDELQRAERAAHRTHHLHLIWGAKECLYKAYGRRQLGFREHIAIPVLSPASGTGLGEIRYEGLHLRYDLFFRFLPEAMWVACLLHPGDVDPAVQPVQAG